MSTTNKPDPATSEGDASFTCSSADATTTAPTMALSSSSSSEETLMKTRLLIDGDGTGDDRRLNQIMKGIIRFSKMSNAETAANPEELQRAHDKLVAQIDTAVYVEKKSKLVLEMNKVELNNYETLYADIEDGISRAKKEIRQARGELVEARKVKKNKMKYDALAKVICKKPDRETSSRKLAEVQTKLTKMKETDESLDERLEMRKKQLHLLVHSIHQLQAVLDKDKDLDESSSGADGDKNLDASNVSSANEEMDVV